MPYAMQGRYRVPASGPSSRRWGDSCWALHRPSGRSCQRLAVDYYNAGTRALLGLLLTRNGQKVLPTLASSINPTTRFDLGMNPSDWPEAREWNIR